MRYREQITLSWALTWRLLLSNIVLLLVVAMLTIAFGSAGSPAMAPLFFALFTVLECLLAWPFVVRRTLPPQAFGLDPHGFALRYWPSVLFGLTADLLSVVPLAALALLLRLLGIDMQRSGLLAISVVSVRLLLVLPAMLAFVARKPVVL